VRLSDCSLNTITVRSLGLRAVIDEVLARGVPAIAPWRDLLATVGTDEAARMIRGSGLRVTSLCRGGLFTAPDEAGRRAAIEDNLRAIDEARAIGADCLVLVCGPLVGKDLAGSRAMVRDGIEAILPYATDARMPLGIEALHPMMVADRSVITTLGEALDLADAIGSPSVGVVVDAYNVWWDPQLDAQIRRASGRIVAFQVSDWVVPITGQLESRGMIGDGCIDLPGIARSVRAAGFDGPVEVEILSDRWWSESPALVLDVVLDRFVTAA
jgi:sugar phosphate isomerase/epimerase